MKKLFVFAVLIAFVMGASAQRVTTSYYKYTGTVADTANGATAKGVTFNISGPLSECVYLPTVEAVLDEYNGSATAYCLLWGSNDNSKFYLVDTLTTTPSSGIEGLTADGSVIYQDLSTGLTYKYLKAELKLSTTGRWNFDYIYLILVPKP
jgi:hypothetical protein